MYTYFLSTVENEGRRAGGKRETNVKNPYTKKSQEKKKDRVLLN